MFDPQPTLAGTLVRVRPLRPEDHDALRGVASDPRIWAQHPDKSRSTPEGFRAFFEEALASGGALLVTDARTGAVIGSSRFHGHDAAAGEVEIGWTFLAPSHWGGRHNGELKRLMLAHAFRSVRQVIFLIAPDNVRSRVAVERIGAELVPGRRPDGAGRDSVVYRITAERFGRDPGSSTGP